MASTLVQPPPYLRPFCLLQHRPPQQAPDPDNSAYGPYPKALARASGPHMPPSDIFPENQEPYELPAPPYSPLKRHKASATQTGIALGESPPHSNFPAPLLPTQNAFNTLTTQTSNVRGTLATQTSNARDVIASQTSAVSDACATQTSGVREAVCTQTCGTQEAAGTQTSQPRQQLTTQTSALRDSMATQTSAPTRVLATQTSVAREAFGVQTDELRHALYTQTSMPRNQVATQMSALPGLDASQSSAVREALVPRADVASKAGAGGPVLQGTGSHHTLTDPLPRATCHAWSIPAEGGWISGPTCPLVLDGVGLSATDLGLHAQRFGTCLTACICVWHSYSWRRRQGLLVAPPAYAEGFCARTRPQIESGREGRKAVGGRAKRLGFTCSCACTGKGRG